MTIRATATLGVLALASATPLAAQSRDDLRDKVFLKNGKVLTGRILNPFDDQLLLLRGRKGSGGGQRQRISRDKLTRFETINEALGKVLIRRRPTASVADDWALVQRAAAADLPGIARALAYHVLLRNPEHAEAHAFLDHRKAGRRWLWRHGEHLWSQRKWNDYTGDWGHPLVLRGEHYEIRTDAGLRQAIDTLLDLERFYLFWLSKAAPELRAWEPVTWLTVDVRKSRDDQPGLTSEKEPWYDPGLTAATPEGGVPTQVEISREAVRTYVPDGGGRPAQLFALATEQLLYNCLHDFKRGQPGSPWRRGVAWASIGFGSWLGDQFGGPTGYAFPSRTELHPVIAELARMRASGRLAMARDEVTNLVHLDYPSFFEISENVTLHWAKAIAFVAYLMDEKTTVPGRGRRPAKPARVCFYEFLRAAFAEPSGDSSSRLDKALGVPVEKLQRPFEDWLATH